MNDCPNAEIRDQLPDLLNERLTMSVRAAVVAHVDGCVDCREELELLRSVRTLLVAPTRRIDVAYVVSALPKPPTRDVRPIRPRRTWVDWRVAAAVTLLAVGGSSVAVMNRGAGVSDTSTVRQTQVAITDTGPIATPGSTSASVNQVEGVAAVANADSAPEGSAAALSMAGHLADLDDADLQELLNEIEQMKAVPIAEPEPVSIKIGDKTTLPDDLLEGV